MDAERRVRNQMGVPAARHDACRLLHIAIVSIVIACDESGSEGEAVFDSRHPVFCHGSTDLDMDAAGALIAELRHQTRSKAEEVKSEQLLKPNAAHVLSRLFGEEGPLRGHAVMYLVDKQYFVIAKVIDLLIEELAHAGRIDLYGSGQARTMAHTLYREGSRAFPTAEWENLLRQFNSLMRARQRKGTKATVDEFFETIERLRLRSRRRKVGDIMNVLSKTRPFADEFQARLGAPEVVRTMDPLLAALPETIRIWHARERRPISILHDQQAALDRVTVEQTVHFLREPLPEFRRFHGPAAIDGVMQVDSKTDPRVQVADLVAGIGRVVGTAALAGSALPLDPTDYIARSSLWADDVSWRALTGLPSVTS